MSSDWKLSLSLSSYDAQAEVTKYNPIRIIEGREEMSALYAYEILVNTVQTECTPSSLMGKRVCLEVKNGDTLIRRVHGIIMTVESTCYYLEDDDELVSENGETLAWYRWIVRPALARACYSKNRLVYGAADLKAAEMDSNKNCGETFLNIIAARWNTPLSISAAAKARIPDFIQLTQNDESDYNFFSRVLACWGLGYVWQMDETEERLCVIDMLSADREFFTQKEKTCDEEAAAAASAKKEPEFTSMESVSSHASYWQANYGVQNTPADLILKENYADAPKDDLAATPLISLHDETWDQLTKHAESKWTTAHYTATHDNNRTCHGRYAYTKSNTTGSNVSQTYIEDYRNIGVGKKVKWRSSDNIQYDSVTYYQTKLSITAANNGWKVTIEGRAPIEKDAMGILPRPVLINYRPELHAEHLIPGEPWPAPQMRAFIAVVEDESLCDEAPLRNMCKVRELKKSVLGDTSLSNSMWVELGSPFADADSGLLSRPRKGNILFCLDRGDLSIPVVLSAMYRNGNQMPIAALSSGLTDSSTLTLRNRSHTGGANNAVAANMNDFSVPRSVHKLWTDKPNCSQIQLVGKDNGVRPNVYHNGQVYTDGSITATEGNFDKDVSVACAPETVLGMVGGINLANAMAGKLDYVNKAEALAAPQPRSHFQGINVVSEKDILQQSVDSQFINAGGIINITAAAGIVLRVGRNVILINENGIEMTGGMGSVDNPGAHSAYNSTDAEAAHVSGMYSGALVLNETGAKLAGTNTKLAAMNDVRMEVTMGSIIELNNYEATIASPHTGITGGAALLNTIVYGGSTLAGSVTDVAAATADSSDAGGNIKRTDQALSGIAALSDSLNVLAGGLGALANGEGIAGALARKANLFSRSGTLLDLSPKEAGLYGKVITQRYSDEITSISQRNAHHEAFNHNAFKNIWNTAKAIRDGVAEKMSMLKEKRNARKKLAILKAFKVQMDAYLAKLAAFEHNASTVLNKQEAALKKQVAVQDTSETISDTDLTVDALPTAAVRTGATGADALTVGSENTVVGQEGITQALGSTIGTQTKI